MVIRESSKHCEVFVDNPNDCCKLIVAILNEFLY
jgi:hypothetical protein